MEKLIASKMMLPGSNRRIHAVHRHSGMVQSLFLFALFWCGGDFSFGSNCCFVIVALTWC